MNIDNIDHFLQSALGTEAFRALHKATDRSCALQSVVGTRAIFGWLSLCSRYGFDGALPGLSGSYFYLRKNHDSTFTGQINLHKTHYEFDAVTLPHVAAGLSVALGVDQAPDSDLKDSALAALGQNLDLLLKAQVIKDTNLPNNDACPKCGGNNIKLAMIGEPVNVCQDCDKKWAVEDELDKNQGQATAPGAPASFNPPIGAVGTGSNEGFTAPKGSQSKRSKKKTVVAKLSLAESTSKCTVCGSPQMRGDNFTGCYCLRSLAKGAEVVGVDEQGYSVSFDPDIWSQDDVSLMLDIVREGR